MDMVCCGAVVAGLSASSNFDVVLYDPSSSALRTVSVDTDFIVGTSMHNQPVRWANVTLTAGLVYRLAMKPTTASTIEISYYDANSLDILNTTPGISGSRLSTRTDAGAWTETPTRRLFSYPIFNSIEVTYPPAGVAYSFG